MIQLLITITTRPGCAPDYAAAFAAIAPSVRLEPGCIEYNILQDSTDPRFDNNVRPDTLVICEKWDSIESLQYHTRSSLVLDEFRKRVKDIKLESSYWLLTPAING
jgi:quinol monooxygenase YgiN